MSQHKKNKHILVVEDDEILSGFLNKYLMKNKFHPTCLYNGDGIPAALEKHRFDVIILDLMLPGRSGLYWLKWIRQYHSYIPVIIISSKVDESDRLQGLEAGARDYVIKPFLGAELLIRLKNLLRKPPRGHLAVELGNIRLDLDKCRIFNKNEEVKLTLVEADILKLLCLNAGATVSRDEISVQIRGTKHQPLDRSIDIHINKLRKKMELEPSKPVLIQTVRGKGYALHLPDGAVI